MYKGKIIAIGLETTGTDIYHDEIIEFSAWSIQAGKEPESYRFLAPIDSDRATLLSLFENSVCVGHNVKFNMGLLERTLGVSLNFSMWDSLELARMFFPSMNQYRLVDCAKNLDLEIPENVHGTLADAWVVWKLLEACWNKGIEFDLSFYDRALSMVKKSLSEQFLKTLQKEIRATFPNRPIRTDLVLCSPQEGLFEEREDHPLPVNPQWVDECFAPGGILEQNLQGYESRPGQFKMAKAVTHALQTSGHIVSEAGTGTGKTYAYLIPSLWWAKKTGKKVVIATHTIPLQEQLYKKDLPVLKQVLPFSFKGALLKGKGNYLCLKRWLGIQSHCEELRMEERLALLSVMVWLRETTQGDWQEIAQIPGLSQVWGELNAENEHCIPSKCSEANRCFMLRARKASEEADVVIINHSLLLSDIKTDHNVLPEFHELVIDEAHHLHQSALEQLGNEISMEQISVTLDQLYRSSGGSLYTNIKARPGFWSRCMSVEVWDRFLGVLDEIPSLCHEIFDQAKDVFALFKQILGENPAYRLTIHHRSENWWEILIVQFENLEGRIGRVIERLKAMQNLANGLENDECEALAFEILARIRELESIRQGLTLALQLEDTRRVSWLEQSNRLMLKTSPVDVSATLREKLFSRLDSAVLTSATISISGSFQHFLAEVGLNSDTMTLIVESPFNYERQMQFLIVKDLSSANTDELLHNEDVATLISEITERMQGRTLVLFTSHRFLREVYSPLKKRLDDSGVNVLAQGLDGSRKAILEEFLKNSKSVLLGANSFWEGIDIPGDKLSCVILIKLPFLPPNMPLIAARSEYLEAQGKNPFSDFLLPEAVLRFKQGFGRLIRSQSDRGLVVLCDARAIEKRYGRVFLTSLPIRTHLRVTKAQIIDKIDRWIEEEYHEESLS